MRWIDEFWMNIDKFKHFKKSWRWSLTCKASTRKLLWKIRFSVSLTEQNQLADRQEKSKSNLIVWAVIRRIDVFSIWSLQLKLCSWCQQQDSRLVTNLYWSRWKEWSTSSLTAIDWEVLFKEAMLLSDIEMQSDITNMSWTKSLKQKTLTWLLLNASISSQWIS